MRFRSNDCTTPPALTHATPRECACDLDPYLAGLFDLSVFLLSIVNIVIAFQHDTTRSTYQAPNAHSAENDPRTGLHIFPIIDVDDLEYQVEMPVSSTLFSISLLGQR